MKRCLIVLIAALGGAWAGATTASSATTDITDMWWNPDESGWGVNVIQQNDVGFATFFVYDQQRIPIWYTAEIDYQGVNAGGALVWAGKLYATTGPWYGGPFDETKVTIRQAGTASFTLRDLSHATLTYSVDGVTVAKSIVRQTWTYENYTGNYLGGSSITAFDCNPSYLNGIHEAGGTITVAQNGLAVSIATADGNGTCSYSGTYSQTGKLGEVDGNYGCSDGTAGSFSAYEMTPTISGFTARVSGANQYCRWSGTFGGVVRQ